MNIFILDDDARKAASYHCDKHVVKMILESGQMLCTAHWFGWNRVLNPPPMRILKDLQVWLHSNVPQSSQPPWKMTHTRHPCTIWTQSTIGNYRWHSALGLALCEEYRIRYGKEHKCESVHRWLRDNVPPTFEHTAPVMTPFAVCMPDECKVSEDPVTSYRNYYNEKKVRFARWKYTETPSWFTQGTQVTP